MSFRRKRLIRSKLPRHKRTRLVFESFEERILLAIDLQPQPGPLGNSGRVRGVQTDPVNVDAYDWLPLDKPVARSATTHSAGSGGSEAASLSRQIVIVDAAVEGYETLLSELDNRLGESSIEVVMLDAQRDGILQITEHLRGRQQVVGIHLLAHGNSGSLWLGNSQLDGNSLQAYQAQLRVWGEAFAEDGDILLYGCNVADGQWGVSFVEQLAAATGTDVAASIDLTGSAELGGDWDLEHATGMIEVPSLFQSGGIDRFSEVLVVSIEPQDTGTVTHYRFEDGIVSLSPTGKKTDSTSGETTSTDAHNFDLSTATLDIKGSTGQDQFQFVGLDSLPFVSTIDGMGGNDIVDLSGYGSQPVTFEGERHVTFEIGREELTISANRLATASIVNLGDNPVLRGGPRANTFAFSDGWHQDLTIEGFPTANAGIGRGVLDFTGLQENLETTINAGGALVVAEVGGTVNATGVNEIKVAGNHVTSIDLSGVLESLEIKVEKVSQISSATDGTNTRVTVRGNSEDPHIAPIVIHQVNGLVLGGGQNTIRFVSGATIPNVTPGNADTTTIQLDYSEFGEPATINLGDGPIDVVAQPVRNNALKPTWGTSRYVLTDRNVSMDGTALDPTTFNTSFSFAGEHTEPISADVVLNVSLEIGNSLSSLDSLIFASAQHMGLDGNLPNNQWEIFLTSAGPDPILDLNSTSSIATFTTLDDSTRQLAVEAASGTFRIQTTVNGISVATAEIDVAAARANPAEIRDSLNANNIGALAHDVVGLGTAAQPWVISWDNIDVSVDSVDATRLKGENAVTLHRANAAIQRVLPEWTLTLPALGVNNSGGMYTLTYNDNKGVSYTTVPLPYDAPTVMVERALKRASQRDGVGEVRAVVEVTGNDAGLYTIKMLDTRTNEFDGLELTLAQHGEAIGNRTASGIVTAAGLMSGGLGTADDSRLKITELIGTSRYQDRVYLGLTNNDNQNVIVTTNNHNNVVVGGGGADTINGGNTTDVFSGGAANDTIDGGADDHTDWLLGGAGIDVLKGNNGDDFLFGGAGNDCAPWRDRCPGLQGGLFGNDGQDYLNGGDGDDYLDGGNHSDVLVGGAGEDFLSGWYGDDFLKGEDGNDELRGWRHDDTLDGGAGNDILKGGQGNDTYVFANGWGIDQVIESNGIDTLDLSQVTRNLTINVNNGGTADSPAKLVVTEGQNTITGNGSEIEQVEKIIAGSGSNTYVVAADWMGTITIDDTQSGRYGTLDLSEFDDPLMISVQKIGVLRGGVEVMVDGVAITGSNEDFGVLTVAGVANVKLGKGSNTIAIQPGAQLPGKLLPPTNAAGYTVVLDVAAIPDASVNFGPAINLNDASLPDDQNPGTSHLDTTHAMGTPATAAKWGVEVIKNPEARPFTLTFGDRQTGMFTTKVIDLFGKDEAESGAEIRQALEALPNVQKVTLAGGDGAAGSPFLVDILPAIGTNPVLSSSKYAVSQLTSVLDTTVLEVTDPTADPPTTQIVNVNQQKMSFFTDSGQAGVVQLTLLDEVGLGLDVVFNYNCTF